MSFIQVIEYKTSRPDDVRAIDEEWAKTTEGKRTARRAVVCRDRNTPGRYYHIVFFDSYESAMENSNMPETQKLAGRLADLMDEPPRFYDLDVLDDMI